MLVWLFVLVVIWIVWWDQTRSKVVKKEMVDINMSKICAGCHQPEISKAPSSEILSLPMKPTHIRSTAGADEKFASHIMQMQQRDRQSLTNRLHWSANQFKPYIEAELQDHEHSVWWEADQSELN